MNPISAEDNRPARIAAHSGPAVGRRKSRSFRFATKGKANVLAEHGGIAGLVEILQHHLFALLRAVGIRLFRGLCGFLPGVEAPAGAASNHVPTIANGLNFRRRYATGGQRRDGYQ